MDYGRIYREFIADRKRREAGLTGYTERHHIVPRALGGGNDASNLIRLTAEDHFFAHLLLAKIHGGMMWAPVAFMIGGQRRDWRPCRSRRAYGWAVRAMAEARKGEGAHQFDWAVHRLVHEDGQTWAGRQSDMPKLGVSKSLANMLIKGRVKSAKGWRLEGADAPSRQGAGHPAYCADKYLFRHVDGREFYGTSYELAQAMGLCQKKTSNIRSGRQRCHLGWYVDGLPPLPVGRGAKLPGSYAGELIKLRNVDGREFHGTRRQFKEAFGLSGGNLSAVINGKRRQTKGWSPAP